MLMWWIRYVDFGRMVGGWMMVWEDWLRCMCVCARRRFRLLNELS